MLELPFDDKLVYECLLLIKNQATVRPKATSKAKISLDLQRPKFLPRIEIFQLLSEIIGRTSGSLQNEAISAFLSVADSCSTDEKCDPASRDEILCLLSALQNPAQSVRYTAIKALQKVADTFPISKKDNQIILKITKRIWITKFDIYEENRFDFNNINKFLFLIKLIICFVFRDLANQLWESSNLELKINGLLESLLEDVVHPVTDVQKAVSVALFSLLKDSPINSTNIALKKLLIMYNNKVLVSYLLIFLLLDFILQLNK